MKRTMAVAVVLGLFLSMAASAPAVSEEKVVLEIMTYSMEQVEFFEDVALEFEREYPNIQLEFITMPQDEYSEALPLLFESAQAPDIFTRSGGIGTLAELLAKGWIGPLHPEGSVPQEWMDRWPQNSFVSGVNIYEGQVYSFVFADNRVSGSGYMFYNKELLTKAGLDPEHPPETWNELKDACEAIAGQSVGACIAIPLDPPQDVNRIWSPIAGSIMTDSHFDLQQGRFCIDDERMIAAYDYIKSFYDDDQVLLGGDPANPYQYNKSFARQALATGQAVFYFDGSWTPSVLSEMGFEDFASTYLGIAHPPYPDGRPRGAVHSGLGSTPFWVSSQTEHADEVWTYIEWMTRPEGFFGREYVSRGFGLLQYVDNSRYATDPNMLRLIEIGSIVRVIRPEPLILNPDLGESLAFSLADRSVKVMPTVGETLLSGGDFRAVAYEMAKTQNDLFLQTLEEELNSGLDVSVDDYTFPDWNLNEDFDYESYQR